MRGRGFSTDVTRMRAASRLPGLAVLTLGLGLSCSQPTPPRHLVRLQAFYCSKRQQDLCSKLPRGAPIPRESLPPVNEAFQLWAWHPGVGTVVHRVEWRSSFLVGDSTSPVATKEAETDLGEVGDSSMSTYNFATAARTRYVMRVLLKAPNGKIQDQDSLVWNYTGVGGHPAALDDHAHH